MDSLPPAMTAPPSDLGAEQALLGHLITKRGSISMVALAFLGPQHFADPIHGVIFRTIERSVANGLSVSLASMRMHFERTGELADVGGPRYLAILVAALDEKGRSAADCARAIHDAWVQRLLYAAGIAAYARVRIDKEPSA